MIIPPHGCCVVSHRRTIAARSSQPGRYVIHPVCRRRPSITQQEMRERSGSHGSAADYGMGSRRGAAYPAFLHVIAMGGHIDHIATQCGDASHMTAYLYRVLSTRPEGVIGLGAQSHT